MWPFAVGFMETPHVKIAQLCWVVVSQLLDPQRIMGYLWEDNIHIFHLATIFLKLCHWLGHSDLVKKWTQLVRPQNLHFCPE